MKTLIMKVKDSYDYVDLEDGFVIVSENGIFLKLIENGLSFRLPLYTKEEIEKFCEDSKKKKSVALKLLLSAFIEVLNKNLEGKTVFFLDDLKKQVIEKLTIKH